MTPKRKKPYFTNTIDKYFAAWILPSTWFTCSDSDERRFHECILAIHKRSKLVNREPNVGQWLMNEDGSLKTDENGGLFVNGSRNPRTYDKAHFTANIVEAVKRNHTGFSDEVLVEYASQYADRAMRILDFLWHTRHGLSESVAKWNPPLR